MRGYYSMWDPRGWFYYLGGWVRDEQGNWYKTRGLSDGARSFVDDANKIPLNPVPTEIIESAADGDIEGVCIGAASQIRGPVGTVVDGTLGAHRKNKSESNREKHENGNARRQADRGNEKGDANRDPPRKRPPNTRGPWPRKN